MHRAMERLPQAKRLQGSKRRFRNWQVGEVRLWCVAGVKCDGKNGVHEKHPSKNTDTAKSLGGVGVRR
jgi:hypothetical protein